MRARPAVSHKRRKFDAEFVSFHQCSSGNPLCSRTDLKCVSCERWRCEAHVKHCSQCYQVVCMEGCFFDDKCCSIKGFSQYCDFYQGKVLPENELDDLASLIVMGKENNSNYTKVREELAKRSVDHLVNAFF